MAKFLSFDQKIEKRKLLQLKIVEASSLIEEAERLADDLQESFSFLDKTYTPRTGGGWDAQNVDWMSSSRNDC